MSAESRSVSGDDETGERPVRRIILFGLSANPPTGLGGHAGLVLWAATQARLDEWSGAGPDEVWVLPVYRHAFAAKRQMAAFDDRMAMARLAFETLAGAGGRVRVLDVEREVCLEVAAQAPTRSVGTIDVIRFLSARHPDAAFALLLGADTYRDLLDGKWRESEALLAQVPIVGVARKGVEATVPIHPGAPALDEVSSSEVRANFEAWAPTLQPAVRDYIEKNGLYGVERSTS